MGEARNSRESQTVVQARELTDAMTRIVFLQKKQIDRLVSTRDKIAEFLVERERFMNNEKVVSFDDAVRANRLLDDGAWLTLEIERAVERREAIQEVIKMMDANT